MLTNNTRGLWRGKRVDNGEWVEGQFVPSNPNDGYRMYIIANAKWDNSDDGLDLLETDIYEVDPSTLGECTGLRDKNGKFIFEGDILMGDIPEDLPNNRNLIGVVRYERTAYMVDFSHSREKWKIQRVGFCSFSNFEVIGNIHDTPELLKGAENNGSRG